MAQLKTERLLLRPPTLDDLGAAVDVHGDPRANQPNGARSPQRSEQLLRSWIDEWAERGVSYWTVCTHDGVVLGFGGVRREDDPMPVANLYYRFRPSAWGQGYATEMAHAAISLARQQFPDRPVSIVTAAQNEPSLRLAEKLGFTERERRHDRGYEEIQFLRWH